MTFAGSSTIFGTQLGQIGPTIGYRTQDESLPGVDGVRSYRLGKTPRLWQVFGRLTHATLSGLKGLLAAGQAKLDGKAYTFVDLTGTSYTTCQLTDFRPVERIVRTSAGYTVRIQAAVRQLDPNA